MLNQVDDLDRAQYELERVRDLLVLLHEGLFEEIIPNDETEVFRAVTAARRFGLYGSLLSSAQDGVVTAIKSIGTICGDLCKIMNQIRTEVA